ncbi:exonuclease SbcC [Pedobacter africanus]|uniref:hypothetical protein n=1 Tax=Pedobacter africanus TaxID=151894 RepID=UPI003397681B
MKFKKVEIQAFRAYNLVNEGTFDFSTEKVEQADFVSIYAPNGFGKTSFYDAVEWGVTHNIHRFLKRYKFNQQVAKSEKNLNEAVQTNILRNRFADDNTPAFVNLYTTDPNLPITRELKKPRKGQADYKFDERETERGYFQEVILSQEWIDSFLKEDNGSDRYQTFIKYFGDKDLDLYYRTLVSLLKSNDENIKKIQKDLNGLQLDLVFDGDHDVLNRVNEVIKQLRESDPSVNYIDAQFTDKESAIYGSLISSKNNELSFRIQKTKEAIKIIEEAISGNSTLDGLEVYFTISELSIDDEKKIDQIKTILARFRELAKDLTTKANLEKQRLSILGDRARMQDIANAFPTYLTVSTDIKKNEGEISARTISINEKNREKIEKDGIILGTKSDINNHLQQVTSFKQSIEKVPNTEASIAQHKKTIDGLKTQISEIERIIKYNNEQLSATKETETNLEIFANQINEKNYSGIIPDGDGNFKKDIANLNKLQKEHSKLTEKLLELEVSIKEQQSFNSDLEDLIKNGLDLINKSNAETCPLCNHLHDSYQDLIDKVTGNALLSKRLQELLAEKNNFENQVKSNREKDKHAFTQLWDNLARVRTTINQRIAVITSDSNKLLRQQQQLKDDLLKTEQAQQILHASLENKTVDDYKKGLNDQIDQANNNIKTLQEKLKVAQGDLKLIETELKKLDQEIKQLVEGNRQKKNDENYQSILDYLAQQKDPDVKTDATSLNEILTQLKERYDEVLAQENKVELKIEKEKKALKAYSEEKLKAQLSSDESELNELKKRIVTYQEYFTTNFKKDITTDTEESLLSFLNKKRENDLLIIAASEKSIELYTLLDKLKDDLIPFLKFEKAKADEKTNKERLKFLKGPLKKRLETEKQNVAEHIDKQINSFFYEDIINDLYRKIDPHPDYKVIKFKCDFTDDKPQLNVCVTDSQREILQIPNLYFSTAQLNILSLSIFLAKALHAKDDQGKQLECIFIDDPIQSMDSINILSTIDLLRSIIVNHKRQVILSTHDLNFHSLLMKKIPKDLFNSKYMELETFGKVKTDLLF